MPLLLIEQILVSFQTGEKHVLGGVGRIYYDVEFLKSSSRGSESRGG